MSADSFYFVIETSRILHCSEIVAKLSLMGRTPVDDVEVEKIKAFDAYIAHCKADRPIGVYRSGNGQWEMISRFSGRMEHVYVTQVFEEEQDGYLGNKMGVVGSHLNHTLRLLHKAGVGDVSFVACQGTIGGKRVHMEVSKKKLPADQVAIRCITVLALLAYWYAVSRTQQPEYAANAAAVGIEVSIGIVAVIATWLWQLSKHVPMYSVRLL